MVETTTLQVLRGRFASFRAVVAVRSLVAQLVGSVLALGCGAVMCLLGGRRFFPSNLVDVCVTRITGLVDVRFGLVAPGTLNLPLS